MTQKDAVQFLLTRPYKFGQAVGFTKLTPLHNQWITDMVRGHGDRTLQAHRIAFKTTCVSLALAIIIILMPNLRTLFLRKTDTDVQEIIAQVRKILMHKVTQALVFSIYGVPLVLTRDNASELSTNLTSSPRGNSQLVAYGCGASMTGKHYDLIFTDDIVNTKDRTSRTERERTKAIYMELQNVRNDGGRIFNTGTPWHKDDAFTLMPVPEKWDCYSTGLLSNAALEALRRGMTPSLFAANYELRHIAEEGQLFTTSPVFTKKETLLYGGFLHIDAGYGGDNATAITICAKDSDSIYMYGKRIPGHVNQHLDEILAIADRFRCVYICCELNADKGFLARDIRGKNCRCFGYNESMNKYYKISTYLTRWWSRIVWLDQTDPAYLLEITDYTEFSETDDCPDSAASAVRRITEGA